MAELFANSGDPDQMPHSMLITLLGSPDLNGIALMFYVPFLLPYTPNIQTHKHLTILNLKYSKIPQSRPLKIRTTSLLRADFFLSKMVYFLIIAYSILTLVLLNLDIPCLCKQCSSRSVGFFRSQLIRTCIVCHLVCEFIVTIWIKYSDWLKIRWARHLNLFSRTRVKTLSLIRLLFVQSQRWS